MPETYPLLEAIDSPQDLRKLPAEKLVQLAGELRSFLLDTVAKTGGHLSSNLGTVELTVALHYVFNTPQDKLVWDVGHQTYPHKILTGRRGDMGGLRTLGGLSGFPKPSESPYDTFSAGHAATSISAALGMAEAIHCQSRNDRVVAIIGDGAMTAGMAFEAMNHAGDIKRNLLVILNDNEMSISKPVGALSKYLTQVLSGPAYNAARRAGERVLSHAPSMLEIAQRLEEHVKGMVTPGTLFEAFGFNYLGPIDGHNLELLIQTLTNLKSLPGPQLLHVLTRKGQGYKLAEADPILYHGVTRFDHQNGLAAAKTAVTFTQTFGDWLCDMAAKDERLVGITPAMETGSGLDRFAKMYPHRYHDVSIAEQHALTFAAGLATQGMKPVVAIYSTFLQRAYDQLIHDIALQNLPVMLAIDRGGLVGADGPTHHGSFDLSFLSCVPNMVIATPANENECRHLLSTAYAVAGPTAVRYPRGGSGQVFVDENPDTSLAVLALGRGEICRTGKKVALLAFGPCLYDCLTAAESLGATVANMRFVKPLDDELVADLAARHELLVSVEDNSVMGGAGAQVALSLQRLGGHCQLLQIGLPDAFIEHGDQKVLRTLVGLDAKGIVRQVEAHTNGKQNQPRLVKPRA